MRINWKVLVAIVLIIGTGVWAFDSLRARSYEGTPLEFGIGAGPVTVTNPSDEPVSAQLTGTGTRSFTVSSVTEGLEGTSTREGTGRSATHLLDVMLPAGDSTFTVSGGTNVTFLSSADTRLSANVLPSGDSGTQSTLIASAVVILAALFYMSHTTGHGWISASRRQRAADLVAKEAAEAANPSHGQGAPIRAYGDNRT